MRFHLSELSVLLIAASALPGQFPSSQTQTTNGVSVTAKPKQQHTGKSSSMSPVKLAVRVGVPLAVLGVAIPTAVHFIRKKGTFNPTTKKVKTITVA